jgi:intracellular sulfur oxidation DsrE/DsrF family protein
MTRSHLALLVLLALPTAALAKKPAPAPTLDPDDAATLQVKQGVKVVFHATQDAWKKGLPKTLFYVDRLVGVYPDKLGVPAAELDFKIVAHDAPVYWFLTDAGWKASKLKGQAAPQDANPHKDVVARIIAAGVDVEVCEVTMQQNGITPEMLLPGVKIAPAGLPRVIDLQLMGYQRLALE